MIEIQPYEVTEKCIIRVSGVDKVTDDDIKEHLKKMYPGWDIADNVEINIVTAEPRLVSFTFTRRLSIKSI